MILFLIIITHFVAVSADDADISDTYYEDYGDEDRIINGEAADEAQFPYQAALIIRTKYGTEMLCGGALISDRWVLTAAHCVLSAKSATVILGCNNLTDTDSESRVEIESSHIIKYTPYGRFALSNDIAVIKMNQSAPFTENIQPIDLPEDGENVYPDEFLTVSGFGKIGTDHNVSSPILNYVTLRSISNEECMKTYGRLLVQKTNLCCVGADFKSTCKGDSGGPIVSTFNGKPRLVGVVSFGSVHGCGGYPTAYTRVEPYKKWIRRRTGLDL